MAALRISDVEAAVRKTLLQASGILKRGNINFKVSIVDGNIGDVHSTVDFGLRDNPDYLNPKEAWNGKRDGN